MIDLIHYAGNAVLTLLVGGAIVGVAVFAVLLITEIIIDRWR